MKLAARVAFYTIIALFSVSFAKATFAEDLLRMGQEISLAAPFCMTRASMVEVAAADQADGPDAAMKVLDAHGDCAMGNGTVKLTRVIQEFKVTRGTVSVIEVEIEAQKIKFVAYIIVDELVDKGQAT